MMSLRSCFASLALFHILLTLLQTKSNIYLSQLLNWLYDNEEDLHALFPIVWHLLKERI